MKLTLMTFGKCIKPAKFLDRKKILILGGAYLHNKVVEAAQNMGLYTIVIDNVPDSPAKKIADKSYDINVSDVDAIVEMGKREGIDAVISVCLDFCQIYYQRICDRLGLFCWSTKEQSSILTQKILFKQACTHNDIDTIQTYGESDIAEQKKIEYPLLVKPSQSRGSRGIAVCYNNQDVLKAIKTAKSMSNDGQAVIEKYMEGKPDFQVTYLVADGVPYVVRTADRYLGSKDCNMEHVAIALSSPSKYTDMYFANVHHKVEKLIRRLNIKNAPLFFQGFIDGDTIRFYDPGMRFPGGEYDRFFSEVTGIDLMRMLVSLAVYGNYGEDVRMLHDKIAYLGGKYIFTLHSVIREGKISEITPKEHLLSIDGVKRVSYRHQTGDVVKMTYDVNQRVAEINIVKENKEGLIQSINSVQKKIKVLDENGDNMIFSPFSPDNLEI